MSVMHGWSLAALVTISMTSGLRAAEGSAKPATVAEAARVLDLSKFPRMPGVEAPRTARMAELSYEAKGDVKSGYDFQKQAFLKQKWQEAPGGYSSDQAASGSFTREGFRVSVSVFPASKPGTVSVTLNQHGNVDLAKLPIPPHAKPFYSGPANAMFLTEVAKDETAAAVRMLLVDQGWQPYGTAGDTQFFRQNAVRLGATVSTAPAQMNKTMIDLQSSLMSAELPAPADTDRLQYADSTTTVSFDTKLSQDELAAYYQQALSPAGWQATTEKPIKIGFRNVLIYRNPAKDLLELQMHDFEGQTRALLKHQTAAEVAAIEAKAKEKLEAQKNAKAAPADKVSLALPKSATGVERKTASVEFKLPNGQVKSVVEDWRKQFAKDGWKEEVAVVDAMAGSLSLTRGKLTLSVTYVDTGFLPAEVTVSLIGGELDATATEK
jgi:hypothetical protein